MKINVQYIPSEHTAQYFAATYSNGRCILYRAQFGLANAEDEYNDED